MLLCSQQLTESQQKDLDNLSAVCRDADGGLPALYPHILKQKRDTDNNAFYYHDNQLIGFLSVFFFYEDACEISIMVHPKHRRQGVALTLIEAVFPLLHLRRMKKLIFSTPFPIEQSWFPKLHFSYRQTEYYMERQSFAPILIANPKLRLEQATLKDVELLCMIDCAAFVGQYSLPERFFTLMSDKDYTVYLAYKDNQPVGKAHIRWQKDTALFSDIAILPLFQKQGLGSELISHCINLALMNGKVKMALDVETSNQKALNLYLRHGFKIIKTHNFWEIELQKFESFLRKHPKIAQEKT